MAGVQFMRDALGITPLYVHHLLQQFLCDVTSLAGVQAVIKDVVAEALDAMWNIRKHPHFPEEIAHYLKYKKMIC